MALYTYDEEADALYVLLAPEPEAAIVRTIELGDRLHVDLDAEGRPVGVEVLYPSRGTGAGTLRSGTSTAVQLRCLKRRPTSAGR